MFLQSRKDEGSEIEIKTIEFIFQTEEIGQLPTPIEKIRAIVDKFQDGESVYSIANQNSCNVEIIEQVIRMGFQM